MTKSEVIAQVRAAVDHGIVPQARVCLDIGLSQYQTRVTVVDLLAAIEGSAETQAEVRTWRCYHCDEEFDHDCDARHHFGMDRSANPACKIKAGAEMSLVKALRRTEAELADARAAIHDESTEAAKAYYAQQTRHQEQLSATEELGYERGLRDSAWPRERLRSLVDVVASWACEAPNFLDPATADKLIEQVPVRASGEAN